MLYLLYYESHEFSSVLMELVHSSDTIYNTLVSWSPSVTSLIGVCESVAFTCFGPYWHHSMSHTLQHNLTRLHTTASHMWT